MAGTELLEGGSFLRLARMTTPVIPACQAEDGAIMLQVGVGKGVPPLVEGLAPDVSRAQESHSGRPPRRPPGA
eukprot:7064521-Alexandrium_andersonii.AAC.1